MKPIIKIENVGKKYRIGSQQSGYSTLRESLAGVFSVARRKIRNLSGKGEEFWALKDVSFDILPGEVIGIIGRNGAGKSTLLKILSRITEPTVGEIKIFGRVNSLLEVGTGFHHELTGRENIYLNGAILGMRHEEISRKFDEIVDFAEIEKFIDTPVKRYSSGMTMRLAFSVAAHLEPEILIVDEVLAVGDAAFQKKCLGQMEKVAAGGRTVLFVSHNLAVVRQLCTRGVMLKEGKIAEIGQINDVAQSYLNESSLEIAEYHFDYNPNLRASIVRVSLLDETGEPRAQFQHSTGFITEIEYVVNEPLQMERLWWVLMSDDGVAIAVSYEQDSLEQEKIRLPGKYVARIHFPPNTLNQGVYQCRLAVASRSGKIDYRENIYLEIFDDTDFGALNAGGSRSGVLLSRLRWENFKIQ